MTWPEDVVSRSDVAGFWPEIPNPTGLPLVSKLLLGPNGLCHRCGAQGERKVICEGCELIVCARCSDEKHCLTCAANQVRGAA